MGRKREQWPPSGFGRRLRQMRAAAGLSQQALAVKAGVSVFAVAKIEQGTVEPSWPMACALADAMGVSLDSLRPPKKADPPENDPGGGASGSPAG